MSHIVSASNQGTLGIQPTTVDVPARNAGTVDAIEVGDLVRFDTAQASVIPGQGTAANGSPSNSKFANVTRDAAASITTAYGIYGVAQERILPGATGKVRLVGVTRVNCQTQSYNAGETIGVASVPVTAQVTKSAVKIGLGTVLTPGINVSSVEVMFDGSLGIADRGGGGGIQNGVYGSILASTFIKDAINGVDSVDILTVGDSNMGYEDSGYSAGFRYAMSMHGANQYATCLFPFADSSAAGNNRSGGNFTEYFTGKWAGSNNFSTGSGNGVLSNLAAAVTASDAAAVALSTAVNAGNFSGLRPNAFQYDAMFVRLGASAPTHYTSAANGPCIICSAGNAFAVGTGGGGAALRYRVVYGTFATGSGQFKLTVLRNVNTVVARSTNPRLTNTGTVGISTTAESLEFNSPEVSDDTVPFACGVDGFNNGTTADYPVGPAAFFWHSLSFQNAKGFAVTNLSYYSGRTTVDLATDMTSNTVMMRETLRELRNRQIAAGGSGRVIFFFNSGINDVGAAISAATYVSSVQSIVDSVKAQWAAAGFPPNDLAFIISTTHPTPNSDGGQAWFAGRPAFNAAAQTWATGVTNVTYVDFSAYRSAQQMMDANLYSYAQLGAGGTGPFLPYTVHLRSNPNGVSSVGNTSPGWTGTNGKVWVSASAALPGGLTGMGHPGSIPNNGYYVLSNYLIRNLLA